MLQLKKKTGLNYRQTDPNANKKSLISLITKKISIYTIFIVFIFCLSLYIRAILPHDATFTGGIIAFSSDDAVFHMRLVENLVTNFPKKIWYEVFTLYPTGRYLHFGPLWTYMIATTSLILGGGSPGLELTQTVGAYFPAVFGSLIIFPTYFIGKEVFDRRVGLLSAFLVVVMPGQILSRSIIGFTDHHIGEVFFSLLFLMFFIMAVKSIKGQNISFNDIQNKDWNKIKTPAILSVFSGIAFSLYMLQWSNGVFYGGIVAIFIIFQYIMDHMRGKSVESLCIVSTITYLAAFPLMLIVADGDNGFSSGFYSYLHILITIGSAIFLFVLGFISVKMKQKNIKNIYYPVTIAGIYAIGLIIAKVLIPGVFSSFKTFFTIFQSQTGGGLTVKEATPPTHSMIFGSTAYPNNFGNYPGFLEITSTYYIALLALAIIGILLILHKWEPDKAMLLIWCIIIFTLTTGQNRWFYYYSVNVAILCGFIGIAFIDMAGLKDLPTRFQSQVLTIQDLSGFISSNLTQHLLTIFIITIVILLVFLPNFNIASRSTAGGPVSSDYYQWYESLNWMRLNTPDTGLDFNAIYDQPSAGETFNYPDTAYGVMSWWDYGHVITYFAHRIPNANPFQAGIGGGPDHIPGASTFFTAGSEEEADNVLWNLGINGKPGSRYIISDAFMAYGIIDVMGIWNGENISDYQTMAIISGKEVPVNKKRWYTTMEGRLHIFDGNGLKHYRMIHESVPNSREKGGNMEQTSKILYNMLYDGNITVENTGYVKIFEFVKGAVITGSASDGDEVMISNTIVTNQGRSFTYIQTTTVEKGSYSFVVPYSTRDPLPGETNFDTRPLGPYTISAGNISKKVDVGEFEVLNYQTVNVDLV